MKIFVLKKVEWKLNGISFMACSIFVLFNFIFTFLEAQDQVRPMIWVKPADKAVILDKIKNHEWAAQYYKTFADRVQEDVAVYLKDPKAYLGKLPLDWKKSKEGEDPSFVPILKFNDSKGAHNAVKAYIQIAIDCGVLYFLTNDEKYAEYASAVLNVYIHGLLPLTPSDTEMNGGWLYPNDHLREAREVGAQIPVLYDFVFPYLLKNKVYDLVSDSKKTFSIPNAETVFRTYAKLAINHGIINCNWPVFESSSLVCNALALSDKNERNELLKYFLKENTAHQDALPKMVSEYKDHEGNWPESLNYSSGATAYIAYLMTLLTKYDSSLQLGSKYPEPLFALPTPYYLTYPNKSETIVFGDGHRDYHTNYDAFEMAYTLGQLEKIDTLVKTFGPLINTAIINKKYDRGALRERSLGASVYTEPTQLLWFAETIEGQTKEYKLPTTFQLPFAGIFIQRNFSSTKNPDDDLMGFVGGGHFVHGHASGMNMELYGQGHVLGVKAGRSSYQSDIHENYYRLFASHNTVIVNGESQGEGGWANLEINQVEEVVMEPKPWAKPVSPHHSFTVTSFVDNKGDGAEAVQERTLAIIRTSPTTGYYVDIFKSKSEKPNQFHDYIYHNIGEEIVSPQKLEWHEDSLRFKASAKKEWVNNRKARNPGWHYFEDVQSTGLYDKNVEFIFSASQLGSTPINMKLFIPGNQKREFTKVMAPPATEAHAPYDKKKNPTIIVRQHGEAWSNPFAVVYEPTSGDHKNGSVTAVENILHNGKFMGLKITSQVDGTSITQVVLLLDSGEAKFEDKKLGITFSGRYAVATFNAKNKLQSVYMGEGSSFQYKKTSVVSDSGENISAYVTFNEGQPAVESEAIVTVKQ